MVFDNAEPSQQLSGWLPAGPGHVIVTSRSGGFAGLAVPVAVDLFSRAESVALLRQHLPTLGDHDVDRLADALGDLPLALVQASGLMGHTAMTPAEYLAELTTHAGELLAESAPVDYPVSLAAAITISMQRLAAVDQAAVQLLHLCAHWAPEPIPLSWLHTPDDDALPSPLAQTVGSPLALRRTLGHIANLGLARITGDTIQLHRLTQAVLRGHQTPEQKEDYRGRIGHLIDAAQPDPDAAPESWPAWAALLPHLLTLDPTTAGPYVRSTACNALRYLLRRGEYRIALPLAQAWHGAWKTTFGNDDSQVLAAANQLGNAYWLLGRYDQARQLNEDTLARRRRVLGDDHPDTLISASNLAADLHGLGDYEQARQLNEDTLARRRRVLGDDHPSALISASNLANTLRELGEHEQARQLNEDALARQRRILGDDHPNTLISASNLAMDLHDLGDYEQARQLGEDTLARRRRVLGDDHPSTLISASNFANSLRELRDREQSRQLEANAAE
jgi:tetratricopeptide (TPR) repeat protein